jgi:hypothetical protein
MIYKKFQFLIKIEATHNYIYECINPIRNFISIKTIIV